MQRLILLLSLACAIASAQTVNQRAASVQFATLSATGTTSSLDVSYLKPSQHTLAVVVTGSPAGCAIQLEGSLDGTNWFNVSGSQTCTSSLMFHVIQRPVSFVRANLTSLSGGSSPTVATLYVGVQ